MSSAAEASLPALELEPRPPVGQLVARALLDHILSGAMAVGDRLPPERELAATLGVGRSAVREAIQALGLLGLLEVRQGAGTYVRGTSSDLLPRTLEWGLLIGDKGTRDLVEARMAVESRIARLAAERGTLEGFDELERLIERMRDRVADGPAPLVELGLAFHLQLATLARNEVLLGLLRNLSELLRVWSRRLRGSGDDRDGMRLRIKEHEAILAACRRGDPDAAETAMREHLDSSWSRLRNTLPDGS